MSGQLTETLPGFDREHAPRWLAESSRRSWWKCECGAEGQCWGRASIGWAHHLAEVISQTRGEL